LFDVGGTITAGVFGCPDSSSASAAASASLHNTPHTSALTEKFCRPHFIDGFVGVLQNVEFVVDDATVRSPLRNAIGEWSPHIHCGRICIFKKKINLSTYLAGQAVGIKEVDDGIWLVTFMDYDLG
jgi:hypothetical protein